MKVKKLVVFTIILSFCTVAFAQDEGKEEKFKVYYFGKEAGIGSGKTL